ncbi:MAG: intersectin-EH binding protein Ibp1 [Mycobacterium sp.]|nr:intersectin-EH binding protein Ibp1 [Mycobacterium sp.]
MATVTTIAHRWLIAGGFAVAVAAAPVVAAVATTAAPASPALASCPSTEVLDPNTGACKPISDQTGPTTNPIEPGVTDLAPGALTESGAGNVGQIPEVNGVPCNGDNTGLCMGLQENNPHNTGGVQLPPVPIGASGS